MYNFPIPIPPISNNYFNADIQNELNLLKERITILENKIKSMETSNENNYMKKDDNYYMI